MEDPDTDFDIRDPDNVILFPAPTSMQPPNRIRERVGQVRSPPAMPIYNNNNGVMGIPVGRYSSSGYAREYREKLSRGVYSPEPQISTENYVPSTGGAASPRNSSFSSRFCFYIYDN